jgi:hypothetical protein
MTAATRPARTGDKPPKDEGCTYAPKCATCPWRTCVKELSDAERGEFVAAFRVVVRHLAPVEHAL